MSKFNEGYGNLFGVEIKEDGEEGEEPDGEGEDDESGSGNEYSKNFYKRWGFFDWAVQVKGVKGCTLDEVYEICVVEFLNLICYLKDKNNLDKIQQEEYLKRNKQYGV